jgi:hypothetical protein
VQLRFYESIVEKVDDGLNEIDPVAVWPSGDGTDWHCVDEAGCYTEELLGPGLYYDPPAPDCCPQNDPPATYLTTGCYDVTLVVKDGAGNECTETNLDWCYYPPALKVLVRDTVIVNKPFDVTVVGGFVDSLGNVTRHFGLDIPIYLEANVPGVELPPGNPVMLENGEYTCQAIARYTTDGAVLDEGPLVISALPGWGWMGQGHSAPITVVDAVIDQPDELMVADNPNDNGESMLLMFDYSDNHPGAPNGTDPDRASNVVDYYQIYRDFTTVDCADAPVATDDPDATADPSSYPNLVDHSLSALWVSGDGSPWSGYTMGSMAQAPVVFRYDLHQYAGGADAEGRNELFCIEVMHEKADRDPDRPFPCPVLANGEQIGVMKLSSEVTTEVYYATTDNDGILVLQLGLADDDVVLPGPPEVLVVGDPYLPEVWGQVSAVNIYPAEVGHEVFHWGAVPATDPAGPATGDPGADSYAAPDLIRVVVPTGGDASLSGWYVKAEDVDRTSNRGTVHKAASTSSAEVLEDGSIQVSWLGMPSQAPMSELHGAVGPVYGLPIDNIAPSAPGQVTVHATELSAEVAWKLSEDDRVVARGLTRSGTFWETMGVTEYRIFRKLSHQSDEHYELLGRVDAGMSFFEDVSPLNRHLTYDYRVVAYDGTNFSEVALAQSVRVVPERFVLSQNRPNPFNPTTVIEYALPEAGAVLLEIYNLTGQKIATLVDGHVEAGYQTAVWHAVDESGRDVASGVYVYRIVTPAGQAVRKMVLTR